MAAMFREMLQREGVKCLVRNEELFAGLGEIPFTECYPELWVVDDEVYPRAQSLLRQYMEAAGDDQPAWRCPGCGEKIEGQFNTCWNCGSSPDRD